MIVIIDTSVIVADFWLKGTEFSILWANLETISAQLVIPEVVLDEAVNKFGERLKEAVDAAQKKLNALEKLLQKDQIKLDSVSIEDEKKKYRRYFKERINYISGSIAPYPNTPHKEIATRAMHKRKPFNSSGKGYRDTLIWETVKEVVGKEDQAVKFITQNSRDFGEAQILFSDLADEIIDSKQVQLFNSLHSFNQENIIPHLKKADKELQHKQEMMITRILPVWLENNLLDLICDEDLEAIVEYDLPSGVGRISAGPIEVIQDILIESIKMSTSGDLIADVKVVARLEVSLELDWKDYTEYSEVRTLLGYDEERFEYASLDRSEELDFLIRAIVNSESQEIISCELTGMSGPYGSWSLHEMPNECKDSGSGTRYSEI